jgi:hypothetical protein
VSTAGSTARAGIYRRSSAGRERSAFVMRTLSPLRCRVPRLAALPRASVLVLVLAAVVPPAALAAVGLGRVTTLRGRFSTQHPASASGLFLRTTGRPPDAGTTEAPAVRQTLTLPHGTRLRPAVQRKPGADRLRGRRGSVPGPQPRRQRRRRRGAQRGASAFRYRHLRRAWTPRVRGRARWDAVEAIVRRRRSRDAAGAHRPDPRRADRPHRLRRAHPGTTRPYRVVAHARPLPSVRALDGGWSLPGRQLG